ncbi:pyroglutamyl peptidase type I, putative [Talaromyces stipitatus ATCC 10500]|uniref:Pyroglutamyl peptidase type I, putative n=1 Tax=Talaromyces stipitatus (strain ATCC 10500 / CBS 375.48 / QM 6759 / NRRL 1006) TaxID=441959 RepID=B8LZH7_TALSN|nr:pyroglutamyl peptidase type I, putative [Talaromyces stipitatus ATCC 10500]EED22059.1 pyroglutamyl peptidase type I, putative [Talaromyces stipitatus ATCC 10500]
MGDVGIVVDPAISPASPPISQSINVLVTGFGPFRSFDVNASFLIAQSLPSAFTLPPKEPVSVPGTAIPAPREVRIYVHPEPIKVSYATIRSQMPDILDGFSRTHNGLRPDLIVHIGIASTRRYYSVESQAHRDNYRIPDVDGRSGYHDGEKIWREKGLSPILVPGPAELSGGGNRHNTSTVQTSGLKITPYPTNDHFLQVWKSFSPANTDLRVSNDAGHYACDFIFYTSLALALEEGRDRSIVFYHVPVATDLESLDLGTKVAVALIKSVVKCWVDGE